MDTVPYSFYFNHYNYTSQINYFPFIVIVEINFARASSIPN